MPRSTRSTTAQMPFAGALLLASLAVSWSIDFFFFTGLTSFPDEERILASAMNLAATGEFNVAGARAWEMPGAAAFFSIPILVFGPEHAVAAIRVMQSLLLVLQAGLVGITASRIFGDTRTGRIAAFVTAFYPFLVFYQGLLLSETLFNTFLVAGMAGVYWWRSRGGKLDAVFVLACACFAAATWTKATLTFVPPLVFAAATLGLPNAARRCATVFVASAVLYAALLSPWGVRNHALFGDFVPLTTSAGQNLYLGNNPANLRAGIDWSTDVQPDVVARIEALPGELDRQREYNKAALAYIASEPGAFIQNAAKKLIRFWNIVPNAQQYSSGWYRWITALSFGPILVLALVSAVAERRRFATLLPVYLLFAYFTAVHTITIASLRYRLPLEPFLILLAARPIAAFYMISAGRFAKHP